MKPIMKELHQCRIQRVPSVLSLLPAHSFGRDGTQGWYSSRLWPAGNDPLDDSEHFHVVSPFCGKPLPVVALVPTIPECLWVNVHFLVTFGTPPHILEWLV